MQKSKAHPTTSVREALEIFEILVVQKPSQKTTLLLAKNLAPYRIGKRSHKQNRAEIQQKYRKSYFVEYF